MPFFRVLMKVSSADGSAVLDGGVETYAYCKAWCSTNEQARESALRRSAQKRAVRILQDRCSPESPLRFDIVRVTPILLWDWLRCSYRGLLMHDQMRVYDVG